MRGKEARMMMHVAFIALERSELFYEPCTILTLPSSKLLHYVMKNCGRTRDVKYIL